MSREDDPTPWFDVREFERLTTRATTTTSSNPTRATTTTSSNPTRALEGECRDAASAQTNERLRACASRDDAFVELASSLPSIRESERFLRDLREDVERTLETNASATSERNNARTQTRARGEYRPPTRRARVRRRETTRVGGDTRARRAHRSSDRRVRASSVALGRRVGGARERFGGDERARRRRSSTARRFRRRARENEAKAVRVRLRRRHREVGRRRRVVIGSL